jgi:hypothetical protein
MRRPSPSGFGRVVVFFCLMDRQFPCPIRAKTERRIHWFTIKRRVRRSPSRGLEASFLSRVERSSTWGFAVMREKGQGEVSLLRQLWDILRPSDILLTDCLMSK